ncbi:MAG: AbrB/MazE/SpoVT family DNA-binding domain-containing protein [Synergistaceae bacterium]|jgi:AbrB family looped-hinge helix DNA binding protein|nr:AbrB/MazE/SpoVT family DNA-binding domain-containing protein [Synergistaceae bacterium]
MLAELRAKSQITLPKAVVTKLGLSVGDKLDIVERDGVISLVPVAVYRKHYVENLEKMLSALDEQTIADLQTAEALRENGADDYSLDEFAGNMKKAIANCAVRRE